MSKPNRFKDSLTSLLSSFRKKPANWLIQLISQLNAWYGLVVAYRCQCERHEFVLVSMHVLVKRHTRLNQHHHWPAPTPYYFQLYRECISYNNLFGIPLCSWEPIHRFWWGSFATFVGHLLWYQPKGKFNEHVAAVLSHSNNEGSWILPLDEIEHQTQSPHSKCQQSLDSMK